MIMKKTEIRRGFFLTSGAALILVLLPMLSSCSQWTAVQRSGASVKFDAFSLAYHKQLGSCSALPITERFVRFEIGMLAPEQTDLFFGMLDVLLNEETLTYKAVYREYPGALNTDPTIYRRNITGSFKIIPGDDASKNDRLALENIGSVEPTLYGEKIRFILKLEGPLQRDLTTDEAVGRVLQTETDLGTTTCPP